MSEGSRGTQAPSRPDDRSLDDAALPTANGNEAGAAQPDGEDFYATVNSAAATRSGRHRGDGAEHMDGVNGASRAAAPGTDAEATDPGSDSDHGVAPESHGAHGASDDVMTAEPAGEQVVAGKSWRDRLSSAVSGKNKTEAGRAATANGVPQSGASVPVSSDTASQPGSSSASGSSPASGSVQTESSTPAPSEAVPVPQPTAAGAAGQQASVTGPTAGAGVAAAPVAAGPVAVASTETAVRAPAAERPEPARTAKPKIGAAHRTRKARLRMSRIDPWSVMKTAFLFSIAAGIVLVVAIYVVWTVIGSSGLFSSINDIVGSVVSTPGDTTPFRIEEYVNTQKVMGVTAFVACIDVVIFTALATLASFLYNLAATMLGGLEVTLAED